MAQLLLKWKEEQEYVKEAIGDEYRDFNLVVASPLGMPTEGSRINDAFRVLIEQNNLPKVVFHSLRHTSITYKLKLSGGDIKAVLALAPAEVLKPEQFVDETARQATEAGIHPALLARLLQNPEMVRLLKTRSSTIEVQT